MNSSNYSVEKMCQTFKVSKSGYYKWLRRKPSTRSLETHDMTNQVRSIWEGSKRRYGSPKITVELRDQGIRISRPRVARIMKKEGIRSIIGKQYRVSTTDSRHDFPVSENHLNRNFNAEAPGQKWVSDITYITTGQGWLYLTIIMDLFDRKIIGWSMSDKLTTEQTVMVAWKMALANRGINDQLIFHSDRGVQYASSVFRNALKGKQITQSMSRKGNCWDNAVAENFFKILKYEMVKHHHFLSLSAARSEMFQFIEIWYNRKRKHSVLGYLSPENYYYKNYLYAA